MQNELSNIPTVRAVLKEVLAEKAKRNPRYSLRAMARDLEVSPSFLSALMNARKKLAFTKALDFVRCLNLDELTAQRLLRAATIESAKGEQSQSFLARSLTTSDGAPSASDFVTLEIDRFKLLSDWHHLAILDLTLVNGFRPDVDWVARQLRISPAAVSTAVDRLVRLGLLDAKEGAWKKLHAKLVVPTTRSEKAVREFHVQMLDKAKEALAEQDADEFPLRDINGTTMAIDARRIPEAKKRIQAFRRSLFEFLADGGEANELYQLNVQLFRLTRDPLSQTSSPTRNPKEK